MKVSHKRIIIYIIVGLLLTILFIYFVNQPASPQYKNRLGYYMDENCPANSECVKHREKLCLGTGGTNDIGKIFQCGEGYAKQCDFGGYFWICQCPLTKYWDNNRGCVIF